MNGIQGASSEDPPNLPDSVSTEILSNNNVKQPRNPVLSTIIYHLLTPLKRFFIFIIKSPIIFFTACFTSFPNLINSLLAVLKVKAKNLNLVLWLAAPVQTKLLGSMLSFSAFAVNVLLNAVFLPKAMKVLFNKKTWRKHPYRSTVALFLGIAGALSLGVIAFEAFSFSSWLAIPMALSAIVANFATRFVTASEGLRRLIKIFKPKPKVNNDKKMQEQYLETLKHVKKNYLSELNQALARAAKTLDKADNQRFYNELLLCLDHKLNELIELDPNLIETNVNHRISERAGLIFDIIFATLMALSGFLIFSQKGLDGFAIISKWLNGPLNTTLEDMNKLFQILLSSPSGVASAILYGMTAFDLRQILTATGRYLYEHPQSIPYALVILSVNLLSGAPLFNVAANIVLNPRGMFSSTLKLFPQLFAVSGAMESIMVNTKASFSTAYLNDANINNPTVNDLVRYFANRKEHPISAEVFAALKQHAFFTKFVSSDVPNPPPKTESSCENSRTVLTNQP